MYSFIQILKDELQKLKTKMTMFFLSSTLSWLTNFMPLRMRLATLKLSVRIFKNIFQTH